MRILAGENVPGVVVRALRENHHEVAWAMEDARQTPDHILLSRAQSEERVVVTFDKDFGELAFRDRLPASRGIVLIRAGATSPDQIAHLVASATASRDDWEGKFSVIDNGEIRMTELP